MSETLGRVPFASLIAAVLCWLGVALFCAMEYQAINASVEQLHRFAAPSLPWLDKVQFAFIGVAALMFIVALALVTVGCLSTGSTRKRVYKGWRARLGGRVSCAIFMGLTYLLHLLWLFLFGLAAVALAVYATLSALCAHLPSSSSDDNCLNLSVFRPLLPPPDSAATFVGPDGPSSVGDLTVCGSNLAQFCTLTDTALTWYLIGAVAAVVVLASLVHFLIVQSANYAHIKDGSKYMELQEIWQYEDNEMAGLPPHLRYRSNGVPKY